MGQIQITDLKKTYKNRRMAHRNGGRPVLEMGDENIVLDRVNLEICKGEMVCILGPSGCGKSTLLKIIAGFEKQSSGCVEIDGKTVNGPSSDHIFVFQHNGLFPWMTVQENVGLGLRKVKDRKEIKEKTAEFLEMVELEGFEHHYPRQLSGGMQRRAELARALAVNPDILIMDEPFSGLDFLTHMKMREEVVNMHEFIRKTTLVVTHDIDDALIMGDRIVVMGGSPSSIQLDHKLDFARPRDFAKEPELSKLRSEMFFMMGVNYAV